MIRVLLLVGCCGLALVSAQYLEATIPLPESALVTDMCYNPVNQRLYALDGQRGRVLVIDGRTNSLLNTIVLGRGVRYIACAPHLAKVYVSIGAWAGGVDSQIVVIDCNSDSIIRRLITAPGPEKLCCVPGANRLYCAIWIDDVNSLYVYDITTDRLVTILPIGQREYHLFHIPELNRLYCINEGYPYPPSSITVVQQDAVLRTITSIGDRPVDLCYNARHGKLYCLCQSSNTLHIYDAARDSLVRYFYDGLGSEPNAIVLDTTADHIYCSSLSGRFAIVNCATDSVIGGWQMFPSGNPLPVLAYDANNRKVYCLDRLDSLHFVVSCETDTTIAELHLAPGVMAACWNPDEDRMYLAAYNRSVIWVVRDGHITAAKEPVWPEKPGWQRSPTVFRDMLFMPAPLRPLAPDARQGKMELAALLDAAGRKVLDLRPGPNDLSGLAPGIYFVHQQSDVRKVIIQR